MHFTFRKFLSAILCLITIFVLAACGGGGSSSSNTDTGTGTGSVSATDNVLYTGSTTLAAITNSNASDLAMASAGTLEMGFSMGKALSSAKPKQSTGFLNIAKAMVSGVRTAWPYSNYSQRTTSEVITETTTGSCGGALTTTISLNMATYAFTGTMVFVDFCDNGETTDGTLTISGDFDAAADDFSSMTMTFENFSFTEGGSVSQTTSGSITYTMNSATTSTMSMPDFRVKDASTGLTYKVENYVVKATEYSTYEEITVASGTFYDPVSGKVTVTTTTALTANSSQSNPRSGVLHIVGSGGTQAWMTFNSADSYTITVDVDGDGLVDYTDGPNAW